MSMAIEYGFEPLSESDLPLIARWLQAPHVAQWWPDPDQFAKIESHMDEKNIRLFVEKAGFVSDRQVDTPYGRTLPMVCRR